jgi:hypothetical protein
MEIIQPQSNQLSVAEKRLVMLYVPLFLFALYQFYAPSSFTRTGDIYLQPEGTITTLLFYVVVIFTMMWGGLVVKKNNRKSKLLYICLGLPTLGLYVAIATVIFQI